MSQKPSLGRTVLYMLTEDDVRLIDQTVSVGAARNRVNAGQQFPAVVVAVFDPSVSTANLKVLLDGGAGAEYWATSRSEGEAPGTWMWPPRV